MDFSVDLSGMELEHPVMNAAGTCKKVEGDLNFSDLLQSSASAVMIGSITVERRLGNEGDVYHQSDGFALNSLGLPNPGLRYYESCLKNLVDQAGARGKKIFVSVAGFCEDDYWRLVNHIAACKVDGMEINLSCPNVLDNGRQHGIACFNRPYVKRILDRLWTLPALQAKKTLIGVKVSPITNPLEIKSFADLLNSNELINFVTVINTVPNCLSFSPDGRTVISVANGLAGLSGSAIKPFALGQVYQWRQALTDQISVIGVGGISTGQDVVDFQRAGATAVQIATSLLREGPKVFTRILSEWTDILIRSQ